jgi:hypothetical protein
VRIEVGGVGVLENGAREAEAILFGRSEDIFGFAERNGSIGTGTVRPSRRAVRTERGNFGPLTRVFAAVNVARRSCLCSVLSDGWSATTSSLVTPLSLLRSATWRRTRAPTPSVIRSVQTDTFSLRKRGTSVEADRRPARSVPTSGRAADEHGAARLRPWARRCAFGLVDGTLYFGGTDGRMYAVE